MDDGVDADLLRARCPSSFMNSAYAIHRLIECMIFMLIARRDSRFSRRVEWSFSHPTLSHMHADVSAHASDAKSQSASS